ncbi:histone-lysine N-methyltransferase, H3 lysine-9 specific SUVH6-like [Oryza brachyantha]|nr:histone-lysine N-methyltransferase, H3 lysine-9 specific SUVH6-like [Oryza brachyantha]
MESGGDLDGRGQHKAVARWRFQRGFVAGQLEGGDRFGARRRGSGTPESNGGGIAEGIGIPGSESDGGGGDGGLERGSSVTGCRKGQKVVVPWRFQVGFKRSWSHGSGLGDGSGSHAPPEITESKFRVSGKQCASAAGRNDSREKVSVTSDHSSVKVGKQTGSVSKKMKVNRYCHCQVIPKNKRVSTTRENILVSLQEFRIIYRKLLQEEQAKWRERGKGLRPDLAAFKMFRERLCVVDDDRRYVGNVPGVQIGDTFNSSLETFVVGLHRQQLNCVDYIKKDGTCVAVSIVSYAQASASNNNLETLLHVGSIVITGDQKIEGTDLAMKHSMDTNTPIRVIHVVTCEGENGQQKGITNYVYGGLYFIEKFRMEKVKEHQHIPTYQLRRMAEQAHVDILEFGKTRKRQEPFDGVFMRDISEGLEKIPVSTINSVSNEYPMPFRYISNIEYPTKHQQGLPSGCDCVNGCSYSQNCACVVKNGGEIPFSHKGTIIDEKPLIYECGPSCGCPPTCHNRVSQHGIKFRLQVFKTKSTGWGVRSLDFIPSGSFLCEYIGELLEEEEAQERKNDEYLFGIGNDYYNDRWQGISKTIPSLRNGPVEDEDGFAIDALNWGNLARFINHSCTPNLFAQNVLYDHDNISMPHIMLFAGEDIPPLQELSYDYNYGIDEVYDSDGNIKKKKCFCGSIECTGWLY